jgi:phosphoribosylanthranilate isomerase
MAPRLPERKKVAVAVEPSNEELAAMRDTGFDYFQIHYRSDIPDAQLTAWSRIVDEKRLWLAPRLPPHENVSDAARALAKFILLDTYHEGFGGSGRTSDWGKFARHREAHPGNVWILAGGLNPENIGEALEKSGARFVDVNSGVESSPGVKNEARLKAFVVGIHRAAEKRAAASSPSP